MKPYGWRMGANDERWGKARRDGRGPRVWMGWHERVVTKRGGRVQGRRAVEEQTGSARPARMR